MSDLLKRLDGLANDFKSRAMFNSEAAVIAATQHIRELEASNATAFAAGIEAAAVETENLEEFLRFQYADAEPSRKAMWKETADVVSNLKDNIRALSPSPGMVMVPVEPTEAMLDHGLSAMLVPGPVTKECAGQVYRAMIEALGWKPPQ